MNAKFAKYAKFRIPPGAAQMNFFPTQLTRCERVLARCMARAGRPREAPRGGACEVGRSEGHDFDLSTRLTRTLEGNHALQPVPTNLRIRGFRGEQVRDVWRDLKLGDRLI